MKPRSIAATAPPSSIDLVEPLARFGLELVGQRLNEVRAGQRIGGVGDAGLVGQDLLGAEGERRASSVGSASASS